MRIVEASGVGADDEVLDVACGPGLTAWLPAGTARHVTGIDITPAMLEQARKRQQETGRTNITWQQGDVTSLPYAEAAFGLVFTRYSLHHMLEPAVVLGEMVRVCKPGGRVVAVDMFTFGPAEDAAAFDRMEQLRDASHVRALPPGTLYQLAEAVGLRDLRHGVLSRGPGGRGAAPASFPLRRRMPSVFARPSAKTSTGGAWASSHR